MRTERQIKDEVTERGCGYARKAWREKKKGGGGVSRKEERNRKR